MDNHYSHYTGLSLHSLWLGTSTIFINFFIVLGAYLDGVRHVNKHAVHIFHTCKKFSFVREPGLSGEVLTELECLLTLGTLFGCVGSHGAVYLRNTGGWWLWWMTPYKLAVMVTAGQSKLALYSYKAVLM